MNQFEDASPIFSPAVFGGSEFLSNLPAPRIVPPETIVLAQNQRPTSVRLIRSGVVRLSSLNEAGEESLLGFRSEGWWAGAELALLDVGSIYSVTTVSTCSICSVPVDSFSQLLMKNHRLLRHFINAQCREVLMEQKHRILRGSSATERLEYLEQEHLALHGQAMEPRSRIRQREVAQLLSISPEHLSRLRRRRANRSDTK